MSITRLHIEDFQCWRALDIDLGPFTAIIGPTGSGKSAVFRALRALVAASPGSTHVRHGATRFQIELSVDGHELKWHKSKSRNMMTLDSVVYDKIGREVPSEIRALLSLDPYVVDTDTVSIHFADQFDKPFLLFESPQRAARLISSVVGVDVLVRATQELRRDSLKLSSFLNEHLETLERLQTNQAYANWRQGVRFYQDLLPQLSLLDQCNRVITEVMQISQVPEPADLIQLSVVEYEQTCAQIETLPSYQPEPESPIVLWVSDYEAVTAELESIQLLYAPEVSEEIDIDTGAYASLGQQCNDISKLIILYDLNEIAMEDKIASLKATEEQWHSEMTGSCPLCGKIL